MRRRFAALDLVLAGLGLSFGLASVLHPFGHDQGVHYYVGREWAIRGAMPYRDAFDYKTPGIFAIHAALVRIFGERLWPIRLAELVCTGALAVLCATLVKRRERGLLGFIVLTTFVVYYGYFSFWDTAQCEVWAATFAVGALVAVRRDAAPSWLAGVLLGLTFLMKPPAILLGGLVVWELRRSLRGQLALAAGFVAPIAATVLYFWAHDALSPMIDVLFGADVQYVFGTRRVSSFAELGEQLVDLVGWFQPFGVLFVALLLLWVVRRIGRRPTFAVPRDALVLGALALVSVAVQLKFYRYHYGVLVPALVLGIAHVQAQVQLSPPWATAVLFVLYSLSGAPSRNWLSQERATLAYATGRISRDAFASRFAIPWLAYSERDSEDAGNWLRDHTEPDEPVLVRGFEPEVYAFAERRAPGRFFWTNPLADPQRQYHRSGWLAEDERAVATTPRFIVTRSDGVGIDAVDRFTKLGYVPCHTAGRLVVLSHGSVDACDTR